MEQASRSSDAHCATCNSGYKRHGRSCKDASKAASYSTVVHEGLSNEDRILLLKVAYTLQDQFGSMHGMLSQHTDLSLSHARKFNCSIFPTQHNTMVGHSSDQ